MSVFLKVKETNNKIKKYQEIKMKLNLFYEWTCPQNIYPHFLLHYERVQINNI